MHRTDTDGRKGRARRSVRDYRAEAQEEQWDPDERLAISKQFEAAARALGTPGNPLLLEAVNVLRAESKFEGFTSRYTSIPESEFFNATLRTPEFVPCHIARDRDGRPLVRVKFLIGERVEHLRLLATKLLMIAEDAEKLAAHPRNCRACRVY